MIIHTEIVDQITNGSNQVTLTKDVIRTPGENPLGMVRKRLPLPHETKGTVLLIHGYGQNRYAWHTSQRSFSTFLAAQGWDVFNLDLRGHGRSQDFGAPSPQVMTEYVLEDLPTCAEEALRLSGHKQVFLIGHSMGGLLSYCAAGTSLRNVIRGVITIGSPYRFGSGSKLLAFLGNLIWTARFTGVFNSNISIPTKLFGYQLRKFRTLWDNPLIPVPIRPWHPGTTEPEILDEYLSKSFDQAGLQVAYAILRAGKKDMLRSYDGRHDYGTAFEWLDKPLLVIAGTKDTFIPPASVFPAYVRSHSTDKTRRSFPLGHIDLIIGKQAPKTVWPLIDNWMSER